MFNAMLIWRMIALSVLCEGDGVIWSRNYASHLSIIRSAQDVLKLDFSKLDLSFPRSEVSGLN